MVYNITFQQIEAFLAIAKHLNMTKAGEAASISQSALSKMLKKFEEGVGMQLFTRSKLGMALTSAGEELYAALEPQYNAMDRGIRLVQHNTPSQTKALRIIEPSSYNYAEEFDQLKSIVRRFADEYPHVEINEIQCDFKDMRQALEFGGTDLVVAHEFVITDLQNISYKRISAVDLYIAMAGNHPLASTDALDFSKLNGEVFITTRSTGCEQTDIENYMSICRWLGFTPKVVRLLPNFQTFLYAIKQGRGMSVCGKYNNIGLDSDIKYYPIVQLRSVHVVVAWRPGTLTAEAQNFIDMLPEYSGNDQ